MACVPFDCVGCCTGAVAGTCLLPLVFDDLCFLDLLEEDEDDFFSTLEKELK